MDVKCPYCDHEQDIDHEDGYGYNDDVYEQQCYECEKDFEYTTITIFHYDVFKKEEF